MELLTLSLFCISLLTCVVLDFSVLYALIFGFLLFSAYVLIKGHGLKKLLKMIISGIAEAKNVLIALILIGMLTGLWRACGTIAGIISYTEPLIGNKTFLLMSFLLCCLISYLTGTAFGTAGTMGVICMTMGLTKGIAPILLGGTVLSGCYFGDRCSPVSTSALLVTELTKTDLFSNLKRFFKDSLVPFLMTCICYLLLGIFAGAQGENMDVKELFSRELVLNLWTLIPAAVMLLLSAFKVKVRLTMGASILAAATICFFVQHIPAADILKISLFGYEAADAEVAALLNGGGVRSMLRVVAIISLSASFAGIFDKTELLSGVHKLLDKMSQKVSRFGGLLITSVFSSMVACNQTLGIMLSEQLYGHLYEDKEDFALALADSVVVIAPLIPWTTACAAPMDTIGAPKASVLAACYLYILPIFTLIRRTVKARSRQA